jgi:hypothetical protein
MQTREPNQMPKSTPQILLLHHMLKDAKAKGKARVPDGSLQRLVDEVKAANPNLLDETFTVSKQTVNKRIQSGQLTVWHRGTPSPVLSYEVVLTALITQAYNLKAPLSVKKCKALMNELIKGTQAESAIVSKRTKEGKYDPNKPVLGNAWWKGFSRRNKALVRGSVGKKFAKNRSEHLTYQGLNQMYKRNCFVFFNDLNDYSQFIAFHL